MQNSNSSNYDPVRTIELNGNFYRNLKETSWWVRIPFAVLFVLAPGILFVTVAIAGIPDIPKNPLGNGVACLGLTGIGLLIIAAGIAIIIGRRRQKT